MPKSRASSIRAQKAIRFVEELSWLLKSYDGVDLRYLADVVKENERRENSERSSLDRLRNYVGPSKKEASLLGILPKIFMNSKWFASNADIAEFAQSALGMKIPRWEKISKFEMIGHIVCNIALNQKKTHERLVTVLEAILADREKERFVIDMRKDQMSWNEIIRRFG